MHTLLEHLASVVDGVRTEVGEGLRGGGMLNASDESVLAAVTLASELGRLVEAVLVEATGEIGRRSDQRERELRLTTQMGCHNVNELLQRLTRLSPATATRLQRAAKATMPRQGLDGQELPGVLPAMREALLDGFVGVDGVVAVAGPIENAAPRIGREAVLLVDEVLAAEARGEGPDGAPPACADLLRVQAHAWAAALDQDGAEPVEKQALRARGITLGAPRDGVIPIHGGLLPEVAAQLERVFDATGSPRVGGQVMFHQTDDGDAGDEQHPVPDDLRTAAQKRHDALATALFAAASSELLPTIGGAAPTLVISVRQEDLINGTGWAHADGSDLPLSTAAARHAGCAGVIQRVLLGDDGRVQKIGTEERVFNRHQRRAITLRDGGCVIPGCGVPAAWCEIHHVVEHANGGPTHTDNGVLLCWYHHRYLDHSGWRIRMVRGVPEVLAPTWIERHPRWRAVTTSRTRMLDLVRRRTRAAPE